jgi:hypothetical protein
MRLAPSRAVLAELASFATPPCLSLYQPTHRHHPDNLQDPIRYRHGLDALEASLRLQHPAAETRALLEPFEALAHDEDFWQHTLDGLAVLGGAGLFRVLRLQRTVPELAIVADSFHTKPLRRFLQSVGRHQVLGLSRHRVQLFEGDRNVLDEIALAPGVPATIDDALGDELTDPHLSSSSYGGVGSVHGGGFHGSGNMAMRHGQGGKKDEVDGDAERFFRAVDRAVHEHHSKPSGLPLILAALPEYHHLFHQVSHNPQLIDAGLLFNPERVPIDELRERAWEAVEPRHVAQQRAWAEAFGVARSRGLGSDELAQVAEAAVAGRVAMLLVESGRQIGGVLDRVSGHVEAAAMQDPHVDDLLDDLGEQVEALGGQVAVVPADRMPTDTGLAATYRY